MIWHCRDHRLTFERPLIMGIVNVTPDSFSDGGRFFDPHAAIDHALKLADDGADILDFGGESTRPGAEPVPLDEELRRVLPVIAAVAKQTKRLISIDTMKAEVARQAIDLGACMINDVAALRDPAMRDVATKTRAGLVLTHMHGTPQTMQKNPVTADVESLVPAYFRERIASLTAAGIAPETICLDPGIGFGKTFDQTMIQLKTLPDLQKLNRPVCLGVSRKGFLGQITGRDREQRLAATLALSCFTMPHAQILRVHDVAEHRDAISIFDALRGPSVSEGAARRPR